MADQTKGARTLAQHLVRIVDEEPGLDLDARFAGAVRPVARKLLLDKRDLSPGGLLSLERSAEMAALAAGVHLRSLDVLEFWKPLLKHCLSGSSKAPVKDLKLVAAEARALMGLLQDKEPSEMRDRVLRMATESAARTEKWLPRRKSKGGGPAAPRYRPGTFLEDEEEDGTPKVRVRPPTVKREKRETPLGKVVGWILTIAAIAGMGYGIVWFIQNNKPEPLPVTTFSALVSQVTDKVLEDSELVLTARPGWVDQNVEHRESDLRLLLTAGAREKPKSLRLVDRQGELLARLTEDGGFVWGPSALAADQLRAEQEAALEALEIERSRPVKVDDEGKLSRPLTADEINKEMREE
jgi:hypothetical protein